MEPYTRIIDVGLDLAEVGRLHEELNDIWNSKSLPADMESDVGLALEEVLSNVLRHSAADPAMQVQVTFKIDADGFEFEVSDTAPPFDPLSRPDPDVNLPLAEREPGGLGVFIVKQLADELSYERADGQNRLRFRKLFPGDGGALSVQSGSQSQ